MVGAKKDTAALARLRQINTTNGFVLLQRRQRCGQYRGVTNRINEGWGRQQLLAISGKHFLVKPSIANAADGLQIEIVFCDLSAFRADISEHL